MRKKDIFTPIEKFGQDHWSLLGFIECLCVDHKGKLTDKFRRNMRVNIKTHPLFGYFPFGTEGHRWKAHCDTRLKDGSQIPNHDDFDCADDLEAAGLLENIGNGMNPVYKMTSLGSRICGALRAFKAAGGSFATFDYDKIST